MCVSLANLELKRYTKATIWYISRYRLHDMIHSWYIVVLQESSFSSTFHLVAKAVALTDIDWLIGWLTDWMTSEGIDWYWLIDWLTDWHWSSRWFIDWLIEWVSEGASEWVSEWSSSSSLSSSSFLLLLLSSLSSLSSSSASLPSSSSHNDLVQKWAWYMGGHLKFQG